MLSRTVIARQLAATTAAARRRVANSTAVTTRDRGFATNSTGELDAMLTDPLQKLDGAIFDIIEREKRRQRDSLTLIPSENFPSRAVLEALGSVMQNKYSEGYPGARYYGGNEFIDMAESLCQKRALEAFDLDPELWGVNVQTLSGSPANFAVYTAVLGPHGRMMALDLPHGGHLSHGYATPTKKISAVSHYFEAVPYRLDEATGLIDYDAMEHTASVFRPKLLVTGASAYSRHIDYERFRRVADQHKAYMMVDMAHISGLVAAKAMPSPFEFADIVTTTTHKSLRGPRGAMVFYRKGVRSTSKKGVDTMYALESAINAAVFPGHQGGPHNHTITALAVALAQAATPQYAEYQQQVLRNAQRMADTFQKLGYPLVSGGTDNHLMLVDLRPSGVDGARVERVLEMANVALNKNTVPGDYSAMVPCGIRLGSPAMTSRGMNADDFEYITELVHRGVQVARQYKDQCGSSKRMGDFLAAINSSDCSEIDALRDEVVAFARRYPAVGYDETEMRYPVVQQE